MNPSRKNSFWRTAFVATLGLIATNLSAQYVGPESGQRITFLADSVTKYSVDGPSPYPTLIVSALEQQGKKVEVNMRADMFHYSDALLKELTDTPPAKNNDWVLLSCGINDSRILWSHPGPLVPLEDYQKNMSSIVDLLMASGSKVVIMTTTMIGEDPQSAKNKEWAPYNDFLRTLAASKHLQLIDLYAEMQATLVKMQAEGPKFKGSRLTLDKCAWNGSIIDQVFMNVLGNEMMATGVLKSFGFTDAQLADARKLWQSQPAGATVTVEGSMTIRQYLRLQAAAADQGQTPDVIMPALSAGLDKKVQERLATPAKP